MLKPPPFGSQITENGYAGRIWRVWLQNLRNAVSGDRYKTMTFPATAIDPQGAVSDPDFDTTNGGYLFDGGSTELLFIITMMPNDLKTDSVISPIVHWTKTSSASGDVLWQLDYKWASRGEVIDSSFTTIQSTTLSDDTPDNDLNGEHLITEFPDIDTTGKGIADALFMKLSRRGGSDTYGADARLIEFDIHYLSDGRGATGKYVK